MLIVGNICRLDAHLLNSFCKNHLFLTKLLTILQNLKMTQIIDLSLPLCEYLEQLPSNSYDRIRSVTSRGTSPYHSLITKDQNHFSFILKENQTPYDLLFEVSFNRPYTLVKIYLLSKSGQLFKIQSQFSRTYFIKKLFASQSIYKPRVDPSSGVVYFRLDYFQMGKSQKQNLFREIDSIFQNLSLQKLYRSIQKLSAAEEIQEQFNMFGKHCVEKKYFKEISKAVSLLTNTNSNDFLANLQISLQKPQSNPKNQKNTVSEFNYFLGPNKLENQSASKKVKKCIKELEGQNANLGALLKRKNGKSNYQPLLINLSSQKIFKEAIIQMLECNITKKSLKVVQSQLGKVTITLEKQDQKIYKLKAKFLSLMPKNTQYHFLDKYFKSDLNIPILISLSLKEQNLPKFMENNRMTISIQTKMRILLQICSAVHTFWEEKNIILYVNNLNKIFITKNLTIKIRNLTRYLKIQPHQILQDKLQVNAKLIDNHVNLSEIYFRLLFNYSLFYVRPSMQHKVQLSLTEFNKSSHIFDQIPASKLLPQALPQNLKDVLVGLNYMFLSYIDKAKLILAEKKKQQRKQQVFKVCSEQNPTSSQAVEQYYEGNVKQLNYKYMCCWILKVFQSLNQERM